MGSLSELVLRTSYHKGRDDIAQQFYLPCMRRASEYDRAVGFFRSTIFLIAWPALREFVNHGGRIRVLCSQELASEDIDALGQGYAARADQSLAGRFLEEVRSLLADETLRSPARVLAGLVAEGILELQVAVLRKADMSTAKGRIFHDKLGIFRDQTGNAVIFKGSMNETWTGLAADGNLESVDVAATWMGARDLERVRNEEAYFSQLWANNYPTLSVRPFPAIAREELVRSADSDWRFSVERLLAEARGPSVAESRTRPLFPHQAAGLASWNANGRRGILAFATGSGKTFTAITALREAITANHEVPIILVPDQVLFAQWHKELRKTTSDLEPRILRAGAGHQTWRENLRLWTSKGTSNRIVLATMQTASTEDFRQRLSVGSHLMIVADEVHRLGSARNRQLLDDRLFGPRLGLSATPERYGDPAGTAAILAFFGGILAPRYTLADAVRDRVLTPYFYRPHTISLSASEADSWRQISSEVARLQGRLSGGDQTPGLDERIKRLLIERARIVKHASAKVPLAVEVLQAEYKEGQRWIVYCDDLAQLDAVSIAVRAGGLTTLPFHSQMTSDRAETLNWLEHRGAIIVAIKCLDEGVDVPSVTHALILASSKNPREFVQRRGRVLRAAPDKPLAYVHDAIVLPPKDDAGRVNATDDSITLGELARAVEFAESADNAGAAADLRQIALEMGLDWRSLLKLGSEDDEDGT